jgi:DNA repair exonuclease SbcCD nuclease subunit
MDMVDEALSGVLKKIKEDVADKKEVDFICLMGDIFDTHRNLCMDHRKKAIDFIKKLVEIKTTIVLIGNHDRISNKDRMSDLHPFYGMEDIPGKLFIINKAKCIRFHDRRHAVLFMPYVPAGEFAEAINAFLKAKHARGELSDIKSIENLSLIMAHQEFYGVNFGPVQSTKGDKWPDNYP